MHAPEQMQPRKKKPLTKRWWFWALVVVAIIVIINAIAGGDEDGAGGDAGAASTAQDSSVAGQEARPDPMVVTAGQMVTDLETNALKAQNTYKDAYVQVTGEVSNIDAQGDYFSISGADFSMTSIRVDITAEQQTQVMEFTDGQQVTVTGPVTSVGEILGYSMDAEEITAN